MPIDPDLPLQVQTPNILGNFMSGQQNALAMQHQLQQLKMQQLVQQSQIEDRRAQTAERQVQTQAKAQAQKFQDTVNDLMNKAYEQDETTGTWSLNRQAFETALVQSGNGSKLPQVSESLDKMDEHFKKVSSERNRAVAQAVMQVQAQGNSATALQVAVAGLQKNRILDASHAQPILDAADQDASPEAIGRMMQKLGQSMPEYQELVNAEEKRKVDLDKSKADVEKVKAETVKALRPTADEHKLTEVTEADGTQGFRVFNGTALVPLGSAGVSPKQPPQTPESMQLTEVTGPDGPALANYSPRSGQLSPVQAPGFAPKQPAQPATAAPNMRPVNVMVDGQPKVATFNPQTGRLMIDGEDITSRATPMQGQQAAPNLQRADVEVDGQPAVANFNPRAGTYTDTSGADISSRVKPKSASESSGSDYKTFLSAYARERGKTPASMTAKEHTDARHAWSLADDKPAPSSAAVPPGDWNKTGPEFLPTIPPQWRKTVEKIAKYDEDPTKVASMRGGMRETVMQWVNAVNPDYDQSKFGIRTKTRQSYTTGTQGQQINAINTAIGHIDQLSTVAEQLQNGGFTPGNKAFNALRTAFGSDKVTNFDTLKDALSGEVASVLSKGVGTVAGIKDAQDKINAANSPKQLAGYVQTLIPIMGSKLVELDAQYKQSMGENDTFSPLSERSKEILTKMGFDPAHPTIGAGGGAPAGVVVQAPNGKTYTFKSQADADAFKAKAGIK